LESSPGISKGEEVRFKREGFKKEGFKGEEGGGAATTSEKNGISERISNFLEMN
jgi:hypothetical protein